MLIVIPSILFTVTLCLHYRRLLLPRVIIKCRPIVLLSQRWQVLYNFICTVLIVVIVSERTVIVL